LSGSFAFDRFVRLGWFVAAVEFVDLEFEQRRVGFDLRFG